MNALSFLGGDAHATLPLDVLAGLTLLSIAPFLLVMTTSFVRIAVVLSLVRNAIGTQALPPNAVVTGLAVTLTALVMWPTFERVSSVALEPYAKGHINQQQLVERATDPLRQFMLRQTARRDVALFEKVAHRSDGEDPATAPFPVLVPAFVVGELRSGFSIGFALYLPFIAIDLAIAAVLTALGMYTLSPNVVALPCKLFLFVAVDGWSLVAGGVASSFR